MVEMLTYVMPQLPEDKPTHLLGIGDTQSLDHCIGLGLDTFDSSYPTKCARHGLLLTFDGHKKITNSAYKQYFRPVDEHCTCLTCKHYTMAYLHHLFKASEVSGHILATIHNLHFMVQLMAKYRTDILNGDL